MDAVGYKLTWLNRSILRSSPCKGLTLIIRKHLPSTSCVSVAALCCRVNPLPQQSNGRVRLILKTILAKAAITNGSVTNRRREFVLGDCEDCKYKNGRIKCADSVYA